MSGVLAVTPQEDGNEQLEDDGGYLEEVQAALQADPTRLGDVFRSASEDPKDIASETDTDTHNWVYDRRREIEAIQGRAVPPRSTSQAAARTEKGIRQFLKRHSLSKNTHSVLEETAEKCGAVAGNVEVRRREDEEHTKELEAFEKTHSGGFIYVYTYSHYLSPYYSPDKNGLSCPRTLMKVGRTCREPKTRISELARGTEVPESPVLLRAYMAEGTEYEGLEGRIHEYLKDIGHRLSDTRGKSEWFLTNLATIDSIAKLLRLETLHRVIDDPDPE